MIYWVFDLDYTLYNIPKEYPFDYSLLKPNRLLENNLSKLPDNKVIFTNGTKGHAIYVCKLMNIIDQFYYSNIFGRYETGLKPNINSYYKILEYNSIQPDDVIIFFEDTIENLEVAKNEFNWITVYIGPDINYNLDYIDFSFKDIDIALNFFNNILK